MSELNANESRIKSNMNLHNHNIHIPLLERDALKKLGFSFDGVEISSTVWLKKDFDLAVKTLDKVYFEWECAGSFDIGIFIKTTGYKL